jgi:hypothetical protein
MPWLNVPHVRQAKTGWCLPASLHSCASACTDRGSAARLVLLRLHVCGFVCTRLTFEAKELSHDPHSYPSRYHFHLR